MRIIAGEFRRRQLHTPKDAETTRPIPDRVKESLFGILRGHMEGATIFDAFAGTGAIGLEAISRGAARCVFVERDKSAARILHQNIEMLGVQDRCDVVVGDALGLGALSRCPRPVTVAFFDPPYPVVREALGFRRVMEQAAKVIDLLTPDGILVLRTPWPLTLAAAPEAPAEQPRRKRPKRDSRRKNWRDEEAESHHVSRHVDEPEGDFDGEAHDQDPATPAPAPPREPADLRLANADGPETHVYHQMAVHLYMRPRGV
ncbi:MAG: RsmD family RNA methyltransferase [Phycisphaerales bacterium]